MIVCHHISDIKNFYRTKGADMGDFDDNNSNVERNGLYWKTELNKRMMDGNRLINIDQKLQKSMTIDKILDKIMLESYTYEINGKEVHVHDIDSLKGFFADKEHKGNPLFEFGRHPGQHLKIYALANGLTVEDLKELANNPNSDHSLGVTETLRGLRRNLMDIVGRCDTNAIEDMYVDFLRYADDKLIDPIISTTESLDNLENNIENIGVMAGSYSYMVQTLHYRSGDKEYTPENIQTLVGNIDAKLKAKGCNFTYDNMYSALDIGETIVQARLSSVGNILLNSGPDSRVGPACSFFGLIAYYTKLHQILGHGTGREMLPRLTTDIDEECTYIKNSVQSDSNKRINQMPLNYLKYYAHADEKIPEGVLPETYQVFDDNAIKLYDLTKEEYDVYKETGKIVQINTKDKIKTDVPMETIQEDAFFENIYDDHPVRDYVAPALTDYPEKPVFDAGNGPDTETVNAVNDFNSLLEKNFDTQWVMKNLENILFAGTTFAPDPDDPENLITVQGKEECTNMFKAFEGKPFDELGRSGNETSHLLAFCMAEGVEFDEIHDMFLNPGTAESQETMAKVEAAKKKLFEAGCCTDFETAIERTKDFYIKYCHKLAEAEQEFLNNGDCSRDAQLEFSSRFYNSQCILVQTLNVRDSGEGSVCKRIEDAVEKSFADEGLELTVAGLAKLPGRIFLLSQNLNYQKTYLDPSKPSLGATNGLTFSPNLECDRVLADDLSKNSKDLCTFAREALHERAYVNNLEDQYETEFSQSDIKSDPASFAHNINQYLLTKESAAQHEAQLKDQIGEPADTIGTLLAELNSWDSGLLRLRGSQNFSDIREAAEDIQETLSRMPRNLSEEDCVMLGEKFTKLFTATNTYLDGKKDVDINADTNAGHRKSIADKLRTFADSGKAYYHLREDRFITDRKVRMREHEQFLKENEKSAEAGELSNDVAVAVQHAANVKNVASKISPVYKNGDIAGIFADAETDYKFIAENLKNGTTPSENDLKEVYTRIFTSMLLSREVQPDGKLEGPFTNIIKTRGSDAIEKTISNLPLVDDYVKKGLTGFKDLIHNKPADLMQQIEHSTSMAVKEQQLAHNKENMLKGAMANSVQQDAKVVEQPKVNVPGAM